MQSTCCQTQNAKRSLHKIAGLLHFTGLSQWLATDSHICHGFGWNTQSPWITVFPRVSCLVSFLRRDRKRRGRLKKKKIDRKEKTTSFWRAEWLCVGELAVHTKMKRKCLSFEILQSKLTFYLSHCQGKAEGRWERVKERGKGKEREAKGKET